MSKALWLADVLRGAGLKVVERDGWRERGHGEFATIRGVMLHHTGAGSSATLLRLIQDGRSGLAGPLSNLFLDDDGTFYVIAAGRTYHAGKGRWQGTTMGNTSFIGIEAKNAGDGKDDWPEVQMDAYVLGVTAILEYIDADAVWAVGHKEWALPKGRKIDPAFSMIEFREAVEASMHSMGTVVPVMPSKTQPAHDMLRKGMNDNASVRELQKLLGVSIDGDFGPKTEAAVKAYQKRHKLVADGLVGPKTWASLLGE